MEAPLQPSERDPQYFPCLCYKVYKKKWKLMRGPQHAVQIVKDY